MITAVDDPHTSTTRPNSIHPERHGLLLILDPGQTDDLRSLLDEALGDMSCEIADTDNWEYRIVLRQRRDRLRKLHQQLGAQASTLDTPADAQSDAVRRPRN
jgi:hypothetical protein